MTQRFSEKIVVIVGGNSGIGRTSAHAFADEGARVAITGRNVETLTATRDEIGRDAVAYCCDNADVNQIRMLFEKLSNDLRHIDVLFVNAGALSFSSIESVSEADWDEIQSINLKGAFFTVQAALPLMSRGGSIVMTGSTAGRQGIPNAAVYAASKAGLRSLGRSMAAELIGRGIRVNVVSPGPVDTPIFHRAGGVAAEAVSDIRNSEIDAVPMKRMGTPREVADVVLFLASDAASFVTGVDFLVAGGAASF